jgi:death-on-curing protein
VSEPLWVSLEVVLAIHDALLHRYGGMPGVREPGLLDSALNRPRQLLCYGRPSFFEMAAAYAHGIVRNHPFLDGNKRTGFMTAYTFLEANGHEFTAPEEEVVIQTLALAAGELDEAGYAAWLADSCRRVARRGKRSRK